MRLLLDANLSPRLLEPLSAAGYEVSHVADLGLLDATDSAIFDRAVIDGYVIVTADSETRWHASAYPDLSTTQFPVWSEELHGEITILVRTTPRCCHSVDQGKLG